MTAVNQNGNRMDDVHSNMAAAGCTDRDVSEPDEVNSTQSTSSLTKEHKDEFFLRNFSDLTSKNSVFENISGRLMPSAKTAEQQRLSVSPIFLPTMLDCGEPNPMEVLTYPPLTGLFTNRADRARIDVALNHLKEVNLLDSLKVVADAEKLTQPNKGEDN